MYNISQTGIKVWSVFYINEKILDSVAFYWVFDFLHQRVKLFAPFLGHHAVQYGIESSLQAVQHVRNKLKTQQQIVRLKLHHIHRNINESRGECADGEQRKYRQHLDHDLLVERLSTSKRGFGFSALFEMEGEFNREDACYNYR